MAYNQNLLDYHEDLYPSRIGNTPHLFERRDPVFYGQSSDPGPLNQEQIEFYKKKGYLFFQDLFSQEEIQRYRDELKILSDTASVKKAPQTILEPERQEVRSIFDIHRTNELFNQLSRDKRVTNIITQLLNSRVYIHQSRINYKPGFQGKEFYWHSDFETWHQEDGMPRMRALSCSITLTENNFYNGPLMLIPQSHWYFLCCIGKTPKDHYKSSLRKQEYGVPDNESLRKLVDTGGIVAPHGPAGSVIFFECNLMHGSNSNISPWPRSNIFFVYNSIENTLVQPYCGLEPRPEYIASRDFTPL
ncbi:ectoine hydroxylase [Nitrosococcus watsonii]|uniref:Ectoine hydroxylase n=1 Tax=Nitrosococcus watsoni (strain C-113) TaxID=105559 RepID=D8K6D8_NITWC|nr:ectoine hydroxylase [Nitrosococcus watsonii]ADJ28465.1 ectoine hydroxylase [Nitrosococcus watsonii C-113]